jgi:alpha-glucosidase
VREAFANFDIDTAAIEWSVVSGPVVASEQADAIELTWPEHDATLRFAAAEHGGLRVELEAPGATSGEIGWSCGADESFFGLGAQTAGLDLKGRTFPLWVQEQGNGKNESGVGFPISNTIEASYAPMGVLHASSGYAAIVGHDAFSEWSLCNATDPVSADATVRLRSYPIQPSMVLVPGGTPAERMRGITDFTGRLPNRPPDWTLGFWVNAVEGPERVGEVAQTMRDEGVPVSAIWTEDWAGSAPTSTGFRLTYEWTWDPETYPNLPTTIDGLNANGYAFLGYFNPFVPNTVSHYEAGRNAGYLIVDDSGETILFPDPAFRQASLVDLTKPDAVDWVQGFQATAIDDVGLNGWMADFAEWWPLRAVPTDYDSSWLYHNLYPLAWQRTNRESFESSSAESWVYFARSGWASANGGTSGIAPTMWGGDQDTNWEYDDGFPTIAPLGAHVGLAGVAIFGTDIAGYSSLSAPNTTKELYYRWVAAGAFHPLMRTHHGGDNCNNWTFDSDAETIAHTRRWASIHALLFPYVSGRLDEAMSDGLPITRHPYLVAPDASWMWDDDDFEWFLGNDILVAPVWVEGADMREVSMPGDGWWPLLGDAPVAATADGDGWETVVNAPVTELPVFVRPGVGLLLLGDVVDTFFGASDAGVSDLEDVADSYRAALYPDAAGAVELAEAGVTMTGTGWTSATTFADAAFDGDTLGNCNPNATACLDGDIVVLRGVTSGELTAGGATLTIGADRPVELRIGLAGAAFGELAAPPAAPDLAADPPTWCERLGL